MFTAVLFITAEEPKQSKCSSVDELKRGKSKQWDIQFSSVAQLCPTL